MRSRAVRAFSLVEMIAVISIIVVLLSLAVVGLIGVLNSSKAKATLATMTALKLAIEEFAEDQPMAGGRGDPRSTSGPDPKKEWRLPSPDNSLGYKAYFGSLPPTPIAQIDLDNPTAPLLNENFADQAQQVSRQFSNMVRAYLQGSNAGPVGREGLLADGISVKWRSPAQNPTEEDYASIECLVLFLTQMSTRSKAVMSKLPEACRSENRDRDRAVLAGTGNYVALYEITDAWDKPLRWAVKRQTIELVRWELRSAGKDGKFDVRGAFAPIGETDDVVLQGP
ncbi:MAG: type II secretion system protein [Phycisphaerae bacterium]